MSNKVIFTHKAELNNKDIYTDFHQYCYTDNITNVFHVDRGELYNMRGEVKLEKDIELEV